MGQRKPTPADWLSLIAESATRLRQVGVQTLSIGDVSVTLTPWQEGGKVEVAPMPQESSNPLHDSSTYAGGFVPGFDLTDINRDHEEDS